jgi:uncharacterized protein DUF6790
VENGCCTGVRVLRASGAARRPSCSTRHGREGSALESRGVSDLSVHAWVAASGLSGFFGHVFTPDAVAESIGWPKGSPFQQEMGFANLALGVLGLIAAGRRDGFREATVIAVAVVGVGATVVHVIDILQEDNLAAGNSIQNVANLLKPALLIPMLIVSRRSEPARTGAVSFDRWRMTVVGTAGMVTAVVGTGFGIGFALELTAPATLFAAVLAAGIAARSASRRPARR